jgi:hypothetical protein
MRRGAESFVLPQQFTLVMTSLSPLPRGAKTAVDAVSFNYDGTKRLRGTGEMRRAASQIRFRVFFEVSRSPRSLASHRAAFCYCHHTIKEALSSIPPNPIMAPKIAAGPILDVPPLVLRRRARSNIYILRLNR